ncbi:MAG: cation-translocating P-type ATPase C-terminal domain-containing protein, partial [Actinobacteria bacterium]|nr:cation-translocating P-type ATPase C-terminal domain-containing protein [Actinomycetota bacterium]
NLAKYVRFILITLVAFVATFLGASIFNIAAGEPFTPVQILWINFLIDMPLGIALGFDKETPGLMLRRPRPRNASILTGSVLVSSGLVGLYMAVVLLGLIAYGKQQYGNVNSGVSMAITSFLFFRIVGTFQSRSTTGTTFKVATFDCKQINYIVIGEVVLSLLVTQWDVLRALLGTVALTEHQWWLSFAPALTLLFLWEIGKFIARRVSKDADAQEAAPAAPSTHVNAPDPTHDP